VIPKNGEVLVSGKGIHRDCMYRNTIGYMPQISRFPDNIRVRQLFDMLRHSRKEHSNTAEELIEEFHGKK